MNKVRGFYRNADDEPLICADCGGIHIDSLSEIGLRWQTAIRTNGWFGSLEEGALIPTGYGIAYYETGRPVAVIMPMPFNLIWGFLRTAWWWMQCPPWRLLEYRVALARRLAFENGFEAGKERAVAEQWRAGLLRATPGGVEEAPTDG